MQLKAMNDFAIIPSWREKKREALRDIEEEEKEERAASPGGRKREQISRTSCKEKSCNTSHIICTTS